MPQTLTLQQRNRATLHRQLLLQRADMPVPQAVEHVAGLQAQVPNPPYIGLWTRLQNFERDTLTQHMQQREIVRAALMRSTLHLVTAADHHTFQPALQPALDRALRAFYGKRARGLPIERLVTAARPFLEQAPRTTGEVRALLQELEPDRDGDAMAYAVRNNLPLVQVPPSGTWGSGAPTYVTAEQYLGATLPPPDLKTLLHRYLAAFGPASVMDFQAWSGMTSQKKPLAPYLDALTVYADDNGKTLYDLPDATIPDADTPAPLRFLPEYDNVLVAYADRTRVYDEAYKKRIFLSAGRVRATVLVDGFVQGVWKTTRDKGVATLNLELFAMPGTDVLQQMATEGERLVRFIEDGEDGAETYAVEITPWSA